MKRLFNEYALTVVAYLCTLIGIGIILTLLKSDLLISIIKKGIYGL